MYVLERAGECRFFLCVRTAGFFLNRSKKMSVMPVLPFQTADSQERVSVRQAANTYGGPGAVRKCKTPCACERACVMKCSKE